MTKNILLYFAAAATLFAATAPYQEDFEAATGAPGADIAAISADWSSDAAGTALISNNGAIITELSGYAGNLPLPSATHAQVLELSGNAQLGVSHPANETTITDLMVRAVRAASQPPGSATDQCALYIDDISGKVAVWHNDTVGVAGNTWTELTNSPVIADKIWIRLTVTKDYRNARFKVAINESEISDVIGYVAATGTATNGPWFDMVQTNGTLAQFEIEGTSVDPGYIEDVVLTSSLDITADAHAGANNAGDGGADVFAFTQDGGSITLEINGSPFVDGAITSSSITILGSNDSDTVTFDAGGGSIPSFTFAGGNGAGTDTLNLTNAPGTSLTYTPTNTTDGTIEIDGNLVSFTGLEPIVQSGSMANVIITDATVAANQTIAITSAGADQSTVAGDFESLTFTNPSMSFTLNSGAGDDAVTIKRTALEGLAGATITLNGDVHGSNDSLTVDAENGWAFISSPTEVSGHGWLLNHTTFETGPTLTNVNLAAVPALGTWGVIILALLIVIGGLRNLPNTEATIVNQESALATMKLAAGIVVVAYSLAIAFGSAVTIWDFPGMAITFALLNYVVAWFKMFAEQNKAQVCRQTA
jgi:hypothetical protein